MSRFQNRRSNGNGNGGAEKKDPPVYSRRFYIGGSGSIEAAVWEKEVGDDKRLTHTVTVSRSYKDGDEWKRSDSFWPQDLPALALALQDCALWIAEQDAKR
jgi:hypothetical protein